jgi:hypothetical protein
MVSVWWSKLVKTHASALAPKGAPGGEGFVMIVHGVDPLVPDLPQLEQIVELLGFGCVSVP